MEPRGVEPLTFSLRTTRATVSALWGVLGGIWGYDLGAGGRRPFFPGLALSARGGQASLAPAVCLWPRVPVDFQCVEIPHDETSVEYTEIGPRIVGNLSLIDDGQLFAIGFNR